jgi:hypothetical protein
MISHPRCNGKDRRSFGVTFRMHLHNQSLVGNLLVSTISITSLLWNSQNSLRRLRTAMRTSCTSFLCQSLHWTQWNSNTRCKLPIEVMWICSHAVGPVGARSTRIPAWNYVPQYTAMDGPNFRHRRRSVASCKEVEFSHDVTRRWQSAAMFRLLESTTDLIYLASGETSISRSSPFIELIFYLTPSLFINLKRFLFHIRMKGIVKIVFQWSVRSMQCIFKDQTSISPPPRWRYWQHENRNFTFISGWVYTCKYFTEQLNI